MCEEKAACSSGEVSHSSLQQCLTSDKNLRGRKRHESPFEILPNTEPFSCRCLVDRPNSRIHPLRHFQKMRMVVA